MIQAYSPLATGELLTNEIMEKMANKYNVTISKICLRYCLQKNTLPLPKSTNIERIKSNFELDFIITQEDMEYLDSLNYIVSRRFMRD